ncbi:hypothetical protein JOC83_001765 [Bacillus iocasae]|uniref:Uncharacterized protein n=1 Tax=Priestia iocasae TaxID=2291674 RepID=A0ABS2QUP6_9BACI|nr:hypothetical protein [Metabacillus iocasae]
MMNRENWKEIGFVILVVIFGIVIIGTALWKLLVITVGFGGTMYGVVKMLAARDYQSFMYLFSFLLVSYLFLIIITPKQSKKGKKIKKESGRRGKSVGRNNKGLEDSQVHIFII